MIRVFLAEDHALVRDGLRRFLTTDDMELVGEAADGNEALEAMRRTKVDVALLDLELPGRSGLEVLTELKGRPSPPKVIVLTGHADDEIAVRCIKAGADGFVSKGRGLGDLAVAVRRVHGGGKYLGEDLAERIAERLAEVEPPAHSRLSNREFEVLCRLAKGETASDISEALFLSPKTVGTYRRRVLDKLQLETTAELARYALAEGLIR